MVKREDIQIRDPFIYTMQERATYYLFGTTDKNPWNQQGTGFEAYWSKDLEHWEGPRTVFSPPEGFWGTQDFWAPEVHWYKGRFYMFASFKSKTHRRGTHILVSDSVLGPYVPLTENPVTPSEWECLDGTLYVDEQNTPYLVFCHEWVQANDGEIWAVQLSDDLSARTGNPVLLFKASSASWSFPLVRRDGSALRDARVTDGPFLHRQKDGKLVMLWSSLGAQGYAMGCAIADAGMIAGPWRQTEEPLISSDGGHGMVFSDFEGNLYVTYHTPNKTPLERFAYRLVSETSEALVLDLPKELG
ncbi:glycoside hydrolase family 43 protein [uncultured Sphaerochaeta sp.]|uniref:glycoside hydrolase family 43 protein n=1 Tax=uncultured Sphaerochaeta sp. TaxID=886478 RepID=UPI002A0A7A0D|nr:glycoside hydrolase family 43 protein [uncultured Sphaerochaeta sp.]